ncbi:MAG TPA: hypothetical protein VH760_04065 [Gaiellaceae bacterium]
MRRRWPIVAFVVAIAAAAAGCGGGGGDSTTTTAAEASKQWANGLCAATNTYKASLQSAGTTLKNGGLSKQTLEAVVSDAKASTQAFSESLKELGPPPVEDSQAKDIFESLRSQLQDDADAIKSATANVSGVSEVLQAVSSVATTLTTAAGQIRTAFGKVQDLQEESGLRQAFDDAPACDDLTGS